jgi:hypothetical protein
VLRERETSGVAWWVAPTAEVSQVLRERETDDGP